MAVLRTLDDVVQDYIRQFRDRAMRERRWFAIQRTLEDSIQRAAMAVSPAGKRLSHQRRIPKAVLRAWADALLKRRRWIRESKTFGELHNLMTDAAKEQHGIGRLTVYDTADRVGAFLKLQPDRVYLHAGTKDGARALGLNHRDWLLASDLPKAFRRLTHGEIEDCLCIYKRHIAAIVQAGAAPANRPNGCYETARSTSRAVRGC